MAGAVRGAVGVFAVGEARGVVFLGLLGDGSGPVRLVRALAIVVIVGGMVVVGVCAVIVGVAGRRARAVGVSVPVVAVVAGAVVAVGPIVVVVVRGRGGDRGSGRPGGLGG